MSLPTVKPLLQKRRLETWATMKRLWDVEKGGLSGGQGASFCQRMPPPSWAAVSTSAAQSRVLCLHKYIFSHVNLVQKTFCCLISTYFWNSYNFCFHVLAESIISTSPAEGKIKCFAKLELKKKKKSKWSLCDTMGIPCLLWQAEGDFPCLVSTCSAGDRGPAAVTSEILGGCYPGREWACGMWLCLYQGEKGTSSVCRRFKVSYSCSEAVAQITCLEDKNKGLQAQMQACRGRVPLLSACPCLPPSLEHSASGVTSSWDPGHWCVRGGTGSCIVQLAGVSKPHWFVPGQDIAQGETDLPTLHSYASQSLGRKWIWF